MLKAVLAFVAVVIIGLSAATANTPSVAGHDPVPFPKCPQQCPPPQ